MLAVHNNGSVREPRDIWWLRNSLGLGLGCLGGGGVPSQDC